MYGPSAVAPSLDRSCVTGMDDSLAHALATGSNAWTVTAVVPPMSPPKVWSFPFATAPASHLRAMNPAADLAVHVSFHGLYCQQSPRSVNPVPSPPAT